MAVVVLNLVGIGAFIPHTNSKALLAVLPNATGLGRSPAGSHDGLRQARHLPLLWEDQTTKDGYSSVVVPRFFPGARLSFEFQGTPSPLDLSAIAQVAQQGWFTVDPALLGGVPDARVSGQIVFTAGTVKPYNEVPASCRVLTWSSGSFSQSLNPVVGGLTVTVSGVTAVKANATKWVSTNPASIKPASVAPQVIYQRDLSGLKDTEQITIFLGNNCAEDVLNWPRNSASGRNSDSDFKWLYGLAQPSQLASWVNAGLPVPIVPGGSIDQDMDPTLAFAQPWGGGGGVTCECNGMLHAATTFGYAEGNA